MDEKIMKKIENGREYRNTLEIRAIEREDETNDMTVEGYATTFEEPYTLWETKSERVVEVVSRDAFTGTDMADVIMQYDHNGRVFARTSNGTLEISPDAHGLKVRADLGGTDIGKQLYQEIKGGYTNKMSFGFTVKAQKWSEYYSDEEERWVYTRTITRIGKLYDVSAVSIPANDGTEISARHALDGEIENMKAERLKALKTEIRKKLIKEKLR